jgi:hypothetical protein
VTGCLGVQPGSFPHEDIFGKKDIRQKTRKDGKSIEADVLAH